MDDSVFVEKRKSSRCPSFLDGISKAFLDGISKATDYIWLKPGGDPVSQHKIQIIGYFANLVGLGFNFGATLLLLKYSRG
jgi:hypothetical protein